MLYFAKSTFFFGVVANGDDSLWVVCRVVGHHGRGLRPDAVMGLLTAKGLVSVKSNDLRALVIIDGNELTAFVAVRDDELKLS